MQMRMPALMSKIADAIGFLLTKEEIYEKMPERLWCTGRGGRCLSIVTVKACVDMSRITGH